ncbi:hypothetical protein BC831DRAFT_441373 [Entophlyctis helioformis]|nr:hypothetical protein BC831DRAFT_441373 [Entophlyctis helioformis]
MSSSHTKRATSGASDNDDDADHERRKRIKTPLEIQKAQLERLMERVDKPVVIPERRKADKVVDPKDTKTLVRNVQGSSAGAGSGDFHVYRALRRKEYARVKALDEAAKKEEEEQEYQKRMDAIRQQEAERTDKNRAKRQKRKQRGNDKGKDKKQAAGPKQQGPAGSADAHADGSADGNQSDAQHRCGDGNDE